MAKATSIILGDELSQFVDHQVSKGRYGSSSEVVRAGLRMLEEHETKLEALRQALVAGEQSGAPRPFDFDAFIARKKAS